jgi:hypothetical protein
VMANDVHALCLHVAKRPKKARRSVGSEGEATIRHRVREQLVS